MAVALFSSTLTPAHQARRRDPVPGPAQDNPVIFVVVDVDRDDESVLQRAVATAGSRDADLCLLILHRRLGLTTDAALAASWHARLERRQFEITNAVRAQLADRGLDPSRVSVNLLPHARLPLGDPVRQAARAVRSAVRRLPAGWAVATDHPHRVGAIFPASRPVE